MLMLDALNAIASDSRAPGEPRPIPQPASRARRIVRSTGYAIIVVALTLMAAALTAPSGAAVHLSLIAVMLGAPGVGGRGKVQVCGQLSPG
ncbi:hypothetical protein BIV57_10905 [Mangrovactinospora gilvigrisea]|uniref:Uncharacterized protein n=1 Tax=Mangrovactinospora gilvigrisea TaxID=1428644 RepID=A0A1J7BFW8_9ACTN|nr:hypothetical protein [Mangrovactinospora gilvigrisea]OIV37469.1 hypothetical protein BIV57_10905 [Mangrovactinospora gilvigrisea]